MKKIIFLGALASLLTVTTVVAASSQQAKNHLSLIVDDSSTIELESRFTVDNLKSRFFTLVTKDGEITTNLNQLNVDLGISIEETNSNKLSNYASFITKQKNYTYSSSIDAQDQLAEAILNKFSLEAEPQEPKLTLTDGEVVLIPGNNGYRVKDIEVVTNSIIQAIESNQLSAVSIVLEELRPQVTNDELLQKANHLSSFKDTQIKLVTENLFEKVIKVTKQDLSLLHSNDFQISNDYFEAILSELKPRLEKERADFTIVSINTETNEIISEGELINGKIINQQLLLENINQSLNSNNNTALIPIDIDEAQIINEFNNDTYTLLGSGISNYEGSGAGRIHNIQFASDERYKTIYIPQGETFKFNSYLGGPVTISRGWKNAYVISGGKIVPAPGGGICQMSTTFYRAALNAGLQIDRASNHSLYVHYYSAYGDGLDAAIFPGSKDLHFTNNTPGDIILHSNYDPDTKDLIVNIIGTDDGRKTELFGPFTAGDNDTNPFGVKTRTNQINWVRQITSLDGEQTQETLTSTYLQFYRY